MAKLLSHHDKYHMHAMLGLMALLHFAYRFAMLFLWRKDSFQPGVWAAASYAIHILLHITSFQFLLPKKRLLTKPMIWPEFRVHNAIFAYRNLLGAILGTWFPDWWLRDVSFTSMCVKLALVLGACKAADMATVSFGDKEVRTTNAMPYPPSTPLRVESFAKHFYAKSQFAATSLAVFGCPVLAFGSVLAIEAASILMTLVRKGLIEAHTYHVVYGLSLFAMFPAIVVSIHFLDASAQIGALRALAATAFAVTLRMPDLQLPLVKRLCGSSKYMAWALAILLAPVMDALQLVFSDQLVLLIAYLGMLSSAGDTVMKLLHPAVVPKATKGTDATAPERAIGG